MGDVNVVLARELTKIHESFLRGKVSELIAQMENIKGEMIVLIEGNQDVQKVEKESLSIEEQYELYKREGLSKNEIIKKIAKNNGVKKNEIYMQFIDKDLNN